MGTFPDYVFVVKKVKLNGLVLSCKTTFTGTEASAITPNQNLVKPQHCNLVDKILQARQMSPEEERSLRMTESVIRSQGSKFMAWGHGDLVLTLDSLTHRVTEFVMTLEISNFKATNY